MSIESDISTTQAEKSAAFLAEVLESPLAFAEVTYKCHKAFEKAGFTKAQATEYTKYIMAMVISLGGTLK